MFKTTSILATLGLVAFTAAPVAFADSINISNEGSASVTNVVAVSANTGDNMSHGGNGDDGGDGGNAMGYRQGDQSSGSGGMGGDGGAGGTVSSGDAFAAAALRNEVNTTDVIVEDNGTDENQYNETLYLNSRVGASESQSSFDLSAYDEQAASQSSETDWGTSASSDGQSYQSSEGWGWGYSISPSESSDSSSSTYEESASSSSGSEQSSLSALEINAAESQSENHDNLKLRYTRTYVGSDDSVNISNSQSAGLYNDVAVAAMTGGNHSHGGNGDDGGDGGNATGHNQNNQSGGEGGAGGWGGNGSNVNSGDSESLADIVNVSGRTMTRVVRN